MSLKQFLPRKSSGRFLAALSALALLYFGGSFLVGGMPFLNGSCFYKGSFYTSEQSFGAQLTMEEYCLRERANQWPSLDSKRSFICRNGRVIEKFTFCGFNGANL